MEIGHIIECARQAKGWSRQALSAKTHYCVSEATIKRIEKIKSYNISSEKLMALCDALHIDMNKFQSKKKNE